MPDTLTASRTIEEPFDLVRLCLDEYVTVRCRAGRTLTGKLQAYDNHMNLVLSEAEETVVEVEVDPETMEETVEKSTRSMDVLYVRGDGVVLISPQ